MDFAALFESALPYSEYLATHATPEQLSKWDENFEAAKLTDEQQTLVKSFVREMKVLVLCGAWCGDCMTQCPAMQRIAELNENVRLRFIDRDENHEFAEYMKTCGAPRVPGVLFLSEDDMVCGRYGDKTLAKYRTLMAESAAGTCSVGYGEPEDLRAAVLDEWLGQFERIQYMLRLSGRLREKHGD